MWTYKSTAQNTVTSPNFLVCKFCGKAQFQQTVSFHKLSTQRKLGEVTVLYAVDIAKHGQETACGKFFFLFSTIRFEANLISIISTHDKKTLSKNIIHCVKYRNFTQLPGVEISWKGTVSAQFRVNRPKLCRNYAFPQTFHTRKLGEITVFYAVISLEILMQLSDYVLCIFLYTKNSREMKIKDC